MSVLARIAAPAAALDAGRSRGGVPGGLVRAARPKQWVKQVLVLAAPAAAGVLDQRPALLATAAAALVFTLAAAGTYMVNDASDVEADRRHPTKRHRPFASGQVPVRSGS